MPSAKAIAWIERLIWVLIYLGLFAVVLGVATLSRSARAAWALITAGGMLAAGGVVLIWIRSRLGPSG
jgi:vacuolar-type H+-ATPase subunit I/STV1